MALSGSFGNSLDVSGTPGANYALWVAWGATHNAADNTSTIVCEFYLIQSDSWSIAIGERSNTCVIDGTTIGWNSTAVENGGGTETLLGSCSHIVKHNEDGTKSLTITARYAVDPLTISGIPYTEIVASTNIDLDQILRGLAHIDTGSGFIKAIPYIDDGSEWKQCVPYIDNGSEFKLCAG